MYKEYFQGRFNKLILMDKSVISKLLQIVQYSLLYVFFGIFIGSFVSNLFPEFDPEKSSYDTIKEIILQFIVLAVAIYYIRKIVKLFPYAGPSEKSIKNDNMSFFTNKDKEININLSTLSAGELIFTIVLISTQRDLLKKIESISNIVKEKINDFNYKIKNGFKKNNENDNKKDENQNESENKEQIIDNKLGKENFQQNMLQQQQQQQQQQQNNYNDRVLPINTREDNIKLNDFNYNSFNNQNNMNNLNSFNNQNNIDNFNSNNNQNINNNDQATNITSLQMNNNLYSQDFKPIEKGGNFSFLSDNSQNVNITKSLDYSSLLSDIYS